METMIEDDRGRDRDGRTLREKDRVKADNRDIAEATANREVIHFKWI